MSRSTQSYFSRLNDKDLVLRKVVQVSDEEKHSLGEHDEIPGRLIPSTLSEENVFIDADNISILKRH
jgi:hypothetical protein